MPILMPVMFSNHHYCSLTSEICFLLLRVKRTPYWLSASQLIWRAWVWIALGDGIFSSSFLSNSHSSRVTFIRSFKEGHLYSWWDKLKNGILAVLPELEKAESANKQLTWWVALETESAAVAIPLKRFRGRMRCQVRSPGLNRNKTYKEAKAFKSYLTIKEK